MSAPLQMQAWTCEKCAAEGSVPFTAGDAVYDVRDRLHLDHERISPECQADWGVAYVHVQIDGFTERPCGACGGAGCDVCGHIDGGQP